MDIRRRQSGLAPYLMCTIPQMKIVTVTLCCLVLITASWGQRASIQSDILGTETTYFIFRMGHDSLAKNIIYFTDGGKLHDNKYRDSLTVLHQKGSIPPGYYVFISTIDNRTQAEMRNDYFFCNPRYVAFFEKELLPEVEGTIGKKFTPDKRLLVGISFGGLNAAWFSAKSEAFKNFALLSPITYPCPSITESIVFSSFTQRRIFISTGINDAENYVASLEKIYHTKGWELQTLDTDGGHDHFNWIRQLAIFLTYFFP